MSSTAESLLKRTGKSLSILAFETSKQSRVLKKKMRITALQKEVKADLRDLGRIVYEAVRKDNGDVLNNEEVTILVDNVTRNNAEIERLREAMERISRAKKTFDEEDLGGGAPVAAEPAPAEEVALEPEKPAEAAAGQKPDEECCAKGDEPCCDDSAVKEEPEQAQEEVEVTEAAEPVLEDKPKPTKAKRTTTPRKRKSTKTSAKSKAQKED